METTEKLQLPKRKKETRRSKLINRAVAAGYKPHIPRVPRKMNEQTMAGYESRMFNWISKLEHRERMIELDNNSFNENVVRV